MRDMDTILNSDEFTEVENRGYINPQVGLDESNRFIDQLRATQAQQNQQIARDTYNLGTSVPSVQGGLGTNTPAGLSYFTSRIQTPQTSSAVANLRATAQAAALNQALQNEQEIWKKRYQDAYRNYQKSAYDKANTPLSPSTNPTENGDVETQTVTSENFYGVPNTIVSETDTHYIYTDPITGEQTKVSKDYLNQIYDENGNITDDGMVILDTRRMLGL